jgi:hypothetical protein
VITLRATFELASLGFSTALTTTEQVTLSSHCRYTVIILLLHCCHSVATLLLHYSQIILEPFLYCCYTFVGCCLHFCYRHLLGFRRYCDLRVDCRFLATPSSFVF